MWSGSADGAFQAQLTRSYAIARADKPAVGGS